MEGGREGQLFKLGKVPVVPFAMSNLKMTGRLAGFAVNEPRFWTEHRAERSITQPEGILSLCGDFCLWFFYFRNGAEQFKYLGFLDMDVHGHDFATMSGTQIRHVFCQLFEPTLNQAFGRHWMAYFSGSKGFHVYILKEEFFFRIDSDEKTGQNKDCMVSALRELLPLDLFVQIDLSVYAYNKGIRPWTVKNPKTGRHRQIRIAPENCPVCDAYDFFEWIAETLSRGGGGPNNRLLSQVTADARLLDKPRTPEFASESALQICAATGPSGAATVQALREWIKKTRSLDHLPVVKRVDPQGNIYFEDQDAWCFCDPGEVTTHSRCKSWWRLNPQDNTASQQCLAERHRQMRFVLDFADAGRSSQPSVVDFDAEFFPGQVTVVPETEQYLPRELMENLLMPEGSRLLVCAPMGTGKTHCLNSLIQAHRETTLKRVLVIGTRQSQCCVFQGAFKNFVNYLDPQERPLDEVPHLILCLNSLMKVAKYDPDAKGFVVPHYDLLVIDEVMTLLGALVSPLLATANTYQTAIFEMFKLLLKGSARVVMMDGLPGPLIYRFLSDQKVNLWHQTKVLKHVRPSEKKRFIFQPDPKKLESLMSDCLANEKSIVVVSDSKKILKYLHLEVASAVKEEAMTICGDSSPTVKRSATDPRINWRALRYLGYNTALGPGASYDARTKEEGAFDEIFVFVTCKSSTPSEIYQLISRIRHPLNGRVHVCVLSSKNNSAFLQEAMDKSLDEQLEMMTHKLMSEVLQFDKLAQQRLANHLPLLVKRQRGDDICNWSELQLNESPPELVRQLVKEQKLRLVYEPNDFLSLLAWAKLEIEKTKNSKIFATDLKRLIRLGGGVLETHACDKSTMSSQTDFMRIVRSEGKTRESRSFPADSLREQLGADVLRKMSDMVEVENFATQVRFFSLMKHVRAASVSEAEDRFARQVERLFVPPPEETENRAGLLNVSRFSRVPASMTATLLEVCPPFAKLLSLLDLEYSPETFHIEGSWNTALLDEKRLDILSALQELGRARRKVDGHYDDSVVQRFSCDYKDYKRKCVFFRSFSSLISDFFKWCGFAVRRVEKTVRPTKTAYVLDKQVSQLRYAMAGFKCDDLSEMVNSAAALLYFAQNYL